MREPYDSLSRESHDNSFDNLNDFSNNSGYVEAIYASGVIVLRPTNDQSKDISTKELRKLMK